MEYANKKQIGSQLRLKKILELKVLMSLHGSLNTCKGVVPCPDLKGVSEQEILEEMREQGVINVRKIKNSSRRCIKRHNTFVFTFNTSVLPKQFGGGRVVRWSWVNFQCRGVLLVWIRVGQGPTALVEGAGWGCLDIFYSHLSFLFSFSLSLGDDPI